MYTYQELCADSSLGQISDNKILLLECRFIKFQHKGLQPCFRSNELNLNTNISKINLWPK